MNFSVTKDSYYNNLEFLYTHTNVEETSQKTIFFHPNERLYFDNLMSDINAKISTRSLGIHFKAVPTPTERATEVSIAALKCFAPGVELIHSVGKHTPHLLAEVAEFFAESLELGNKVYESLHSHNYFKYLVPNTYSDVQSREFLEHVAKQLQERYKCEISHLHKDQCSELAHSHFREICSFLKEKENKTVKFSLLDLFLEILNVMDPSPEEEIQKCIADYVINRQDRFLRSENLAREIYLAEFLFLMRKQEPRESLAKLIHIISKCVAFKDDWNLLDNKSYSVSDKNSLLSLKNPILRCKDVANNYDALFGKKEFNNAFFTSIFNDNVPMQKLAKRVTLLLMRWKLRDINHFQLIQMDSAKPILSVSKIKINAFDSPEEVKQKSDAIKKAENSNRSLKIKEKSRYEEESDLFINLMRNRYLEGGNQLMWDFFNSANDLKSLSDRFLQFIKNANGELNFSLRFWVGLQASLFYKREFDLLQTSKDRSLFYKKWSDSELLNPLSECFGLPLLPVG